MTTYQDIKICNCAGCGMELLASFYRLWSEAALKHIDWPAGQQPPFVATRLGDRPYCAGCATPKRRPRTGRKSKFNEYNSGLPDEVI